VILDTLVQSGRYTGLHPSFPRAFDFLTTTNLTALAPGRHEIDEDRLFVLIDRQDGRGHAGARLEAHRRYIDIQLTLEGAEEIGWLPLAACERGTDFDAAKDIGFFDAAPRVWLPVPPGSFTIFFPEDAHAPLAGRGPLLKAIVKIAA
jgi:YhcH/YjgK/YiaL family protein